MTRGEKIIGFILVLAAGVWGCAKAPESAGGKGASIEAKAKKLEEDYRAAAAARDQFREKLLAVEDKLNAAETRATQLQTERDTLKTDLQSVATQYEAFRKNLKTLLGQAEHALANPTTPPVAVGVSASTGEPERSLRN